MKNKNFLLRAVNLLLVLCLLGAYQTVLYARKQQENLTEMQSKINQLEGQLQGWSQALEEASGNAAVSQADAEGEPSTGTETSAEQAENAPDSASEQAGAAAALADGAYQGSAQGFGGEIQVSVEVSGGQIASIEIVSADQEDEAYLSMAEDIVDTILEQQTTEVDTVSGATYSSGGIRDAVADALKGASE